MTEDEQFVIKGMANAVEMAQKLTATIEEWTALSPEEQLEMSDEFWQPVLEVTAYIQSLLDALPPEMVAEMKEVAAIQAAAKWN